MEYDDAHRHRAAAVIQSTYRALLQKREYKRKQDAIRVIQAHARGWHSRKKLRKLRDNVETERRFESVIARHRERIKVLELEKREVVSTPAAELADWQLRRTLAAVRVQAHWRGLTQRRRWAQRSPERTRRDKAARMIQAAFKNLVRTRRAARDGAEDAAAAAHHRLRHSAQRLPSQEQRAAVHQHAQQTPPQTPGSASTAWMRSSGASVLFGSPAASVSAPLGALAGHGAAAAGQAGLASGPVGGGYMSTRRYQDLEQQVDARVAVYRSLARHQRRDTRQGEVRLADVLRDHDAATTAHLRSARTRQKALIATENLCVQLEQLRPLAEIPDGAAPRDYPRPPAGSERMEHATMAHALALAEARVGGKWWGHLKTLNSAAVRHSLMAEDEERWEAADQAWRDQFERISAEEAKRSDGLDNYRPIRRDLGAATSGTTVVTGRRW